MEIPKSIIIIQLNYNDLNRHFDKFFHRTIPIAHPTIIDDENDDDEIDFIAITTHTENQTSNSKNR